MLVLLISAIICAGCTVKEDRSSCPCMLVLDFSKVDTAVIRSADVIMAVNDGIILTDSLEPEDLAGGKEYSVPRSEVELGVWSGAGNCLTERGMTIPLGEECPPVYFHTSVVEADREMVCDTVRMRKNHCRLTINLNRDDEAGWEISLLGNVDGYQDDGLPAEGDFCYSFPAGREDVYHVILPRQRDDSLILEIDDGSGAVKMFTLGEYIAESGFDWTAPDLEDLTIEIDVSFVDVTLKIQGWDKVYGYDVII